MMKVNLAKLFFAVVLFFAVCGCAGGGSQGTGGVRFQGTLYSESLKMRALTPLSGITVTIGSTGDFAVTDGRGFYSIASDWTSPDVELFFEGNGLNTRYVLHELPRNAREVTLDFEVNRVENSLQLINTQIVTAEDSSFGSAASGGASSAPSSANTSGGSSSAPSSKPGGGSSGSAEKVTICHNPDSKNPTTMTVSEDALSAHLAHGDTLGPCPDEARR